MNICIAVYFCHLSWRKFLPPFFGAVVALFLRGDFCLHVPRLRALHVVAICAPFGGFMDNLNYEKQNTDENKDFFEKLTREPNYKIFYKIYKKLPKILAVVVALLMWIWSIIDVTCFIYQSNSYYSTVIYYGVMRFTSRFPALLIWWLIGAVLAFATYFFSAMHVSAIVLRTDAVLEINAKVKETPAEKQQND